MDAYGIHSRFFFNPLIFYIFPIFFIYSLWISFPFKYIKSIVKSWQKGGMLESNCFFLHNNIGIYKRYIYAKHNTKESTAAYQ